MHLIIDTRESAVAVHSIELDEIAWELKQITIGDYAIVDDGGNIAAIFERKTLADAAASMKDGRWNNREKLFDLRRATGCVVIFIVEGLPAKHSYPDLLCDRTMPYKAIESSLIHMMIRDDIRVIHTMDTLDTARTLVRWVKSIGTLAVATRPKNPPPDKLLTASAAARPKVDASKNITGGDESMAATPSTSDDETAANSPMQLLTVRHEKSDLDCVRELWATIRGITAASADNYIRAGSLIDLINGRIILDDIKTPGGRRINKTLQSRLANFAAGGDRDLEIRMLAAAPGVSRDTAKLLIEHARLRQLISYGVAGISIIQVGKRKFGDARAGRLVRLFGFVIAKLL